MRAALHRRCPGRTGNGPVSRAIVSLVFLVVFVLHGAPAEGQQEAPPAAPTPPGQAAAQGPAPAAEGPHHLGPLDVSVMWRVRTEVWDFFEPATGGNAYAFGHTLLRVGVGRKSGAFDWWLEGAADAVLGLPVNAAQPAPVGQLGLGGTYYAANGRVRNRAGGFLKQAYVGFALPANGRARIGRFTFLDGADVQPADKTLATVINTRIAQRLIGDFGFAAVQRSFDGILVGFDRTRFHLTLFGARPTEGVFQTNGMAELDVNLFYGALTVPVETERGAGRLRAFAIAYADRRSGVLKTDNRPATVRQADGSHVRIGTYGIDYAQVLRTDHHGELDFVLWGALQNGAWGRQTHRAGAFAGELGWQAPVGDVNLWLSAGYSYGSGDSSPGDQVHGTFFQILPTPRVYARFPFFNMMNNEDLYGSAVIRFPRAIAVRSEVHALRLARAQDLWYAGGGAFQPGTFGYAGRASGGASSLADVWDVSVNVPLRPGVGISTYYAHAWGKRVVAASFPGGTGAGFGYVEMTVRF